MKWIADQDRVSAAAGIAPAQVYVHTDGDSWGLYGHLPGDHGGAGRGARRGREEAGPALRAAGRAGVPQAHPDPH